MFVLDLTGCTGPGCSSGPSSPVHRRLLSRDNLSPQPPASHSQPDICKSELPRSAQEGGRE